MKTFIATYLLDKEGDLSKTEKPMVEKIRDKIEYVFDKANDYERIKEKADSIFPLTSREQKPSIHITDGKGIDVKVVGKIDLDSINQKSRPKKKTKEEKEAERLQQVSEQMAADVQKQMEDFDKEIEAFKVMKDNLAKVDRAYFKHQNSTEYGNMAKELEDCAKAMSIGELNAAKGRLAQKAKEYLEHTGLGSASIFHKNSETRRKLAFLMLNKTDPTLYAQFEARANQLRSGSDKISAASLEGMEGVGKPLPAVRSIRVEDIAGEAPAQQERKAHNRNMGAQVKTDKKFEEPEAGLNGPNHN